MNLKKKSKHHSIVRSLLFEKVVHYCKVQLIFQSKENFVVLKKMWPYLIRCVSDSFEIIN